MHRSYIFLFGFVFGFILFARRVCFARRTLASVSFWSPPRGGFKYTSRLQSIISYNTRVIYSHPNTFEFILRRYIHLFQFKPRRFTPPAFIFTSHHFIRPLFSIFTHTPFITSDIFVHLHPNYLRPSNFVICRYLHRQYRGPSLRPSSITSPRVFVSPPPLIFDPLILLFIPLIFPPRHFTFIVILIRTAPSFRYGHSYAASWRSHCAYLRSQQAPRAQALLFRASVSFRHCQCYGRHREEEPRYALRVFRRCRHLGVSPFVSDPSQPYDNFRAAVFELYPAADEEYKYTIADLDFLIADRQRLDITSLTDLANYHAHFLAITSFLISKHRLSQIEQQRAYPRGFPPALWSKVAHRLQLKLIGPLSRRSVSDHRRLRRRTLCPSQYSLFLAQSFVYCAFPFTLDS